MNAIFQARLSRNTSHALKRSHIQFYWPLYYFGTPSLSLTFKFCRVFAGFLCRFCVASVRWDVSLAPLMMNLGAFFCFVFVSIVLIALFFDSFLNFWIQFYVEIQLGWYRIWCIFRISPKLVYSKELITIENSTFIILII